MDAGGVAAEIRLANNRHGNLTAMKRTVKAGTRINAGRRRTVWYLSYVCNRISFTQQLNLLTRQHVGIAATAYDKRRLSKNCYRDVASMEKACRRGLSRCE